VNAQPVRSITVIAPMLNEAAHIENLVADLAVQDFEGVVDLIVADGGSTDDSVSRLTAAAAREGIPLTVIDNPARWVSPGLNACIGRATGDLIVRMDCHTRYPADYLRLSATAAEETTAWNVGGVVIPAGRTPMERAVGCAMDSPFGGVHWTRHSGSSVRAEVDTVHCGAYRPEGFARAGLFDESLVRNQDDDLAFRLRQAGGTIVLDPAIHSHYVPRGSLRGVFRQYFEYGFWKTILVHKHRQVISGRSLAPPAFVTSIVVLASAALFFRVALWLLLVELVFYAVLAVVFAAATVRRHREAWKLVGRVLAILPTFHLAYGLGNISGGVALLRRRFSRG
jgi:succinoglycan biosynthesis protein ExoA